MVAAGRVRGHVMLILAVARLSGVAPAGAQQPAKHPPDAPVSAMSVEAPGMLQVRLFGLVPGSAYDVRVQLDFDDRAATLVYLERIDLVADRSRSTFLSLPIRVVAPGTGARLQVKVDDAYPGLKKDESLLTHHNRRLADISSSTPPPLAQLYYSQQDATDGAHANAETAAHGARDREDLEPEAIKLEVIDIEEGRAVSPFRFHASRVLLNPAGEIHCVGRACAATEGNGEELPSGVRPAAVLVFAVPDGGVDHVSGLFQSFISPKDPVLPPASALSQTFPNFRELRDLDDELRVGIIDAQLLRPGNYTLRLRLAHPNSFYYYSNEDEKVGLGLDLADIVLVDGASQGWEVKGGEAIPIQVRESSLAAIFAKHSAFHCGTNGTDKGHAHSYDTLYERLLSPYQYRARHVLEIGVDSGASIAAWADYFPNALITGVDIQSETWLVDKFGLKSPRIELHELDATMPSSPLQIATKDTVKTIHMKENTNGSARLYDVIIEDASHEPIHQVQHFTVFAPTLALGGIYIIEDIDGAHEAYVRREIAATVAEHGLRMEWFDLRSVKNRFDDILAVAYRGL